MHKRKLYSLGIFTKIFSQSSIFNSKRENHAIFIPFLTDEHFVLLSSFATKEITHFKIEKSQDCVVKVIYLG